MDENNQNNRGGRDPKKKQNYTALIVTLVFTLFIVGAMHSWWQQSRSEMIPYSQFKQMLKDGEIESVVVSNSKITITPKEDSKNGKSSELSEGGILGMEYYTVPMYDPDLEQTLSDSGVARYEQQAVDPTMSIISMLIEWILPIAVMMFLFNFMMKKVGGGGGLMNVGKNNAKVYVQRATGVTFADVAGEDEAKESLTEIVDFLHNPAKYTTIGAKLPKGALLVGPPGTGKTLLAKAVAGEAKVPFFSISGSEFVEMFVGVGASRVRDLFKQAAQQAPCIIFIDEIDAIGRSRDSRMGGNDEREQTLNQLLSEMDGFDASKGLLVLAATNRPEILDKALLRPGRFDRRVIVDKPDLKGRVSILKVHAKDVKLDETVDFNEIALATSGAVGADLANMINEAAIMAVKNGRKAVCQKDLFEAVEVVLVGKEKKDRIMSQEERRIVSYHEVGHALVNAIQKDAEPVQKITIIPRTMGALGYVMQVPEEEKYLNSEKELHAMLVGFLGGRAAEEVVFGSVTTGAANDIEKATSVARQMVTRYGMSKKFGLIGLETIENQYLSGRSQLNCSDATAAEIDKEVIRILKECYAEAKQILGDHREALDKIAAHLIEKETITGKEFMKILHQVEGTGDEEEKTEEDSDMTPRQQEAGEVLREMQAEHEAAEANRLKWSAPADEAEAAEGENGSAGDATGTDAADAGAVEITAEESPAESDATEAVTETDESEVTAAETDGEETTTAEADEKDVAAADADTEDRKDTAEHVVNEETPDQNR
ncbi:ATP-dependent zinc metalloprotease FtsH [[Clostridium] aminophilum]|uniref:ATP-dependent zinc metalloprotease FtsH n=1 Tax=[Clostridium] aminophilum TaxID=1526 RepID=A0A1I6IBB8_9FIRM|nr:ATP-dependent zinc metalloprotease FtsH [[Clostridium] aminophilum]SFR63929.1 cell division protease FtsH [[Clostridium] aminophilum]